MVKNHNDIIRAGEDWSRIVQLNVDGVAYVATGATVTAQLKDKLKSGTTANGSVVSCTDTGNASFAIGKIEVVYADTVTTLLSAGTYELEILVVESGGDKKIFFCKPDVEVFATVQG
jgi:hypothetical protein